MTVAAIIPAYNEENNISTVIRALKSSPALSEVIVVDDGSTDRTADAARVEDTAFAQGSGAARVRVITQDNQGKAGAMATGARATNADIIFFADADLVGVTPDHVAAVIAPVAEGRAGMTVGIRGWGRIPLWVMEHLFPIIGGERAILREHFLRIAAHKAAQRYGIETVMNAYCKRHAIPVILVRMQGVSIIRKEQKVGFRKGFAQRLRMFGQILKTEIALMGDRNL